MGTLDEQIELPAQDWEQVKRRGDKAVEEWIDNQMNHKQAVIVMIGAETASRKFVRYEIQRAWHIKKPLLGVRIHGLKNSAGSPDHPGENPFAQFGFSDSNRTYAYYVPVYDPADYTGRFAPTSNDIYAAIQENIATWATQGYRRP